ncbi:IQ domain-containing protein M [Orycteropus afer afer]|uniref:IQ domain-containing protein M n=1 Tax=Orycteropus afer afer TaxID=1230840 RepID=A0AC54Z9Q6_ORYAF|nr:IQ domain-containing protein M [Orycteropus afer afer]
MWFIVNVLYCKSKIQATSINVFRNKHQKTKSGKYIPMEIKKRETLGVVQEHQIACKNICFPKELSKNESFKDSSHRTSFKEPPSFHAKERAIPLDWATKKQVKLSEVMSDIESVSKKMEKEKQQHQGKSRNRFLDSYAFPVHLGLPPGTLNKYLLKHPDRSFYDWRGIASPKSFRLTYEPSRQSFSGSFLREYYDKTLRSLLKTEQKPVKPEPEPVPRVKTTLSKIDKNDNKVKRIGPHIEIFQVFRERNKFIITKKIIRMITIMQAHVRGWLERKRFQRIMKKALYHGPNLKAVLNMYRRTIHRVRYRLGLWRTRQIVNYTELEEWMDRKKFYETMFAKREDWQGLERSELLKYFNDCGHFPTQKQIDNAWNLVHTGDHERFSELIKKFKAIEMIFTLYPPLGAKVIKNTQLKSTWLRPIVNGEEGYKYIVTGHPILKRANIRIVGKLVANSMRERKYRQRDKS